MRAPHRGSAVKEPPGGGRPVRRSARRSVGAPVGVAVATGKHPRAGEFGERGSLAGLSPSTTATPGFISPSPRAGGGARSPPQKKNKKMKNYFFNFFFLRGAQQGLPKTLLIPHANQEVRGAPRCVPVVSPMCPPPARLGTKGGGHPTKPRSPKPPVTDSPQNPSMPTQTPHTTQPNPFT